MNVAQSAHTPGSAKAWKPQAPEIDQEQSHTFNVTLIQAGFEIDLLSAGGNQLDGGKTDEEEESLKKDKYLAQVQENKVFAMLKLDNLESVIEKGMLDKRDVETHAAEKLQMKKDNYFEAVRKNTGETEGKPNLATPVSADNDHASPAKNGVLESFKVEDKLPRESGQEGKSQPDLVKGEHIYKNPPGNFATALKSQNLQKSASGKDSNRILKPGVANASATKQKVLLGKDKGDNSTQNQTLKNDLISIGKPSATQSEAVKVEDFEAQLRAKTSSRQIDQEADIEAVLGKVKVMMSANKNEMVIKLTPAHLGKLQLKLKKRENSRLIAELKVDSLEARDILKNQLGDLRQGLEEQGIIVEEFTLLVANKNRSGRPYSSVDDSFSQSFDTSVLPSVEAAGISSSKPDPSGKRQFNNGLDIVV